LGEMADLDFVGCINDILAVVELAKSKKNVST
jgi:hypothetical protein